MGEPHELGGGHCITLDVAPISSAAPKGLDGPAASPSFLGGSPLCLVQLSVSEGLPWYSAARLIINVQIV